MKEEKKKINLIMEKYGDTIKAVMELNNEHTAVGEGEEHQIEADTAISMIASVCNVRTGRIEAEEGYTEYKGVPEDFDCEAFLAEFEE